MKYIAIKIDPNVPVVNIELTQYEVDSFTTVPHTMSIQQEPAESRAHPYEDFVVEIREVAEGLGWDGTTDLLQFVRSRLAETRQRALTCAAFSTQ